METYQRYNGYGISYSSMTGTTEVDDGYGNVIKTFSRLGEMKGEAEAKKYIDGLNKAE